MTDHDPIACFDLSVDVRARLDDYVRLIAGYERANVSGARSPQAVARLVADALALLDVTEATGRAGAGPWADLGSGAGLPGIPLALALPDLAMTLIDSVAKKCAFLEEAAAATGVGDRVRVVCARSERLAAAGSAERAAYGVVLAKAVGSLATVVELAAPLLRCGGLLLASKTGRTARAESAGGEAAGAACGLAARRIAPLPRSPLSDSVCAVFEKVSPTPERLPRREGLARSRPLGRASRHSTPSR